ncbi:MAG: sigma factor [Longimicrobiales bacterium]|nr:sigma factor [Longimicrobiales bacterium]
MGDGLAVIAQRVVGNREDAIDVVWEVYAKLCERIVSGEELDPEPQYLATVVRNLALDRHRAEVNRENPAWHTALAEGVRVVPTPD